MRSLKASVSINRHVMTFEETVAKLCEYEVTANIKGSKTSNEHAFLNVQDGVCKFFSAGKCLKGDSCRYRHETPSLPRGGAKGRAKDENFKEKIEKVQAKDDDIDFPDVIKPKKNANGGFKGNCFGCGDPGHTKRDCPKKKDKSKKDRSDANFADAVDEEWNNMAEEVATEISEILSVTVQGPVMDSGASRTISPNRDDFVPGSLRASPNLKLKFGDGVSSKADGVGTLVVKNPNNNQMVVLYNCILFADCPRTLLSVPQLDSQLQSEIVFKGGRVKVLKGEKVLMSGKKLTDRLYHMDVEMVRGVDIPAERVEWIMREEITKNEMNFSAVVKSVGSDVVVPPLTAESVRLAPENAEELMEMHACLKHANFRDLRAVLQLPPEKFESCVNCPHCAVFKGGKALPLKETTENRARVVLQRICIDLIKGPALTAKGETGALISADQASLRVFCDPLKLKSAAGQTFSSA